MSDTPIIDALAEDMHAAGLPAKARFQTMLRAAKELEGDNARLTAELARAMRVVEAARKWFAADRGRYESTILEDAVEEWEAGR